MKFVYPPGATPIDADEESDLIPSHISTQAELNEFEQANIVSAEIWAFERKHSDILSEKFIRQLHKRMFADVWKWAGEFRKTNKNIGADSIQIGTEIHKLCADTKYWIENDTYEWVELGVRFHHRLVSIHPFNNGNGRHARLLTDILLWIHEQPKFTWGSVSLTNPSETRSNYISALQQADNKNFDTLIRFVLS